MTKLAEAVNLYNSNAEWTIDGDDYQTLNWLSKDITKPTKKQLEDLLPSVATAKAEADANKAEAKAALLDRLGITAEEAKLLLS